MEKMHFRHCMAANKELQGDTDYIIDKLQCS
jgi:hypothetical protein